MKNCKLIQLLLICLPLMLYPTFSYLEEAHDVYYMPLEGEENVKGFTCSDQIYLYRRAKQATALIPEELLSNDLDIAEYRRTSEHEQLKENLQALLDNKNAWPEYIYIARLNEDKDKFEYVMSSSDVIERHELIEYDLSKGMQIALEKKAPVVTDFTLPPADAPPAVYYPLMLKNEIKGFLVFVKLSWSPRARRVMAIYTSEKEHEDDRMCLIEWRIDALEREVQRLKEREKEAHRSVESESSAEPAHSAIKNKDYHILSHVKGIMDDKRSLGGSGHAVFFGRPEGQYKLYFVEIFGSRYGYPRPPDEDFMVYILDEKRNILHTLKYPYNKFERGKEQWVALEVDGLEIPEKFWIAIDFNPHQTKGVYVGFEKTSETSHSKTGTPQAGFLEREEPFEWMIRAYVRKVEE